ncbi:MAG: hypothetical protein SFY96_12880 [Planctomycetota bacterium]|nr:hypothetical protein [Planctomycetota bacterium]
MKNTLVVGVVVASGAASALGYVQDFQAGGALSEWSTVRYLDGNLTTRPGVRTLGRFAGNESTTLSLTGLDAGTYTLSFRLYTIGSWDGQGPNAGPDYFGVQMNGSTFFRETFNNVSLNGGKDPYEPYTSQGQSFGGLGAAVGTYAQRTGSSGFNGLDLVDFYWDQQAKDTYYDLTFTLNVTGPDLSLTFFGEGLQDGSDESWAIDDVAVVPAPGASVVVAGGLMSVATRRRRAK